MNKNMSITIIISMSLGLAVGALVKHVIPEPHLLKSLFHIFGQIFIHSLQMLAVPLVVVSLICSICNNEDVNMLSRVGIKSFALYIITTLLAVIPALLLAYKLSPGQGEAQDLITDLSYESYSPALLPDIIINIVPSNIFSAFAQGDILAIMFFVTLFSMALLKTGECSKSLISNIVKINAVMEQMTALVMKFTPIGIFCLMIEIPALYDWSIFFKIFEYFSIVLGSLLFHFLLTLSFVLIALTNLNPLTMISKMIPVHVVAFITASSIATITTTKPTIQNKLGVSKRISAITVPLGATINMDGTAIMQVVATIFIANVYSINLELVDYLTIITLTILTSIGTAGIPSQGLVTLAMILDQLGLPLEGIGLIIGADRILDMLRTVVNVHCDAVVACIVAHSENEIDRDIFNDLEAGIDE